MAELIPIGVLAEYVFCPRSAWLAHVAGLFQPNEFVVEGRFVHKRVHELGYEQRGSRRIWRKVLVFSKRLGLVGYADAVELVEGWYQPVEYKRGKARERLSDRVQLCSQALCLEEMTRKPVEVGFIYYAKSRRRVPVGFDSALRHLTLSSLHQVRELLSQPEPPPPDPAPKCRGCSQYPACLPQGHLQEFRWEEWIG